MTIHYPSRERKVLSQDEQTKISNMLDRIQKLPSMPSLVVEILESFDIEDVDLTMLANKIACDQALVARVMRVANSPFFGLSGQIGSISEAVLVLGFSNLRGLVTAAAIINAFPPAEKGFDWMAFWRHSIATAVCAKVLAKHAGLNPESAFTAGLLHDIGKLVLGVHFPEVFAQACRFDFDGDTTAESLQAERAALGFDHAALGGELARRWHFPATIQQAIGLHHMAAEISEGKTLTDVVCTANLFSHALEDGRIREDKASLLATEAWARLGLDSETLETLALEAQRLYTGATMLIG